MVAPSNVDYGLDLSCAMIDTTLPDPDGETRTASLLDVTEDFDEVTGRDCLSEALARRISTPRGTLFDPLEPEAASNYGTDVGAWVNDDLTPAGAARAGASVDQEFRKDERIVRSQSTVAFADDSLSIETKVADGAGPFRLTLNVTDAGVALGGQP